jgi:lysophospholipase L1-like esterase
MTIQPKTTFKQKMFLFLFSLIFLTLILEIGLRLGGYCFFLLQDRQNQIAFNEYRILCIGESTTALGGKESYPSQLEEILKSKIPNVNVINKGRASNFTSDLEYYYKDNLDLFKPQIVIFMMGINDSHKYTNNPQSAFKRLRDRTIGKMKVYRLLNLIRLHVKSRIEQARKNKTQTLDLHKEIIIQKEPMAGDYDFRQDRNALYIYPKTTIEHYNRMVKIALERNIKVICMQYPLRPLQPLKDIIRYQQNVYFLENIEGFKEAWELGKAKEYFTDSFAVYFGHCTGKGNRIIAENLAELVNKIFNKHL